MTSRSHGQRPKKKKSKGIKFRLLFDENFSPKGIPTVKQMHDVVYVGRKMSGATDEEVFAYAVEERRLIVTKDTKEFRRLLKSKGEDRTGIIALSPHASPKKVDKELPKFLSKSKEEDLYGKMKKLTLISILVGIRLLFDRLLS